MPRWKTAMAASFCESSTTLLSYPIRNRHALAVQRRRDPHRGVVASPVQLAAAVPPPHLGTATLAQRDAGHRGTPQHEGDVFATGRAEQLSGADGITQQS